MTKIGSLLVLRLSKESLSTHRH